MDAAAFRQADDALDIDLDLVGGEMDRESSCGKSPISRVLKRRPQFANHLAQRGAGFFFVGTAPQQADEPFAAFMLGFDQGKIAENGAGLLGSKFDQPAIKSQRQPSHQRNGKARAAFGRHLRFPFSQRLKFSSLPHPKNVRPGW